MFEAYLASHDLKEMLSVPYACPFPACTDRKAWEGIAEPDRQDILDAAERMRGTPYPMLLATEFMAFARRGDRKNYETPYFLRRKKLILSTLAYCIRTEQADLDDVINGLWCILEESSWVIPAHNVDAHEGAPSSREKPLPDVRNPMIDLFAAQTAMILSFVVYLTGAALDQVTPMVGRRVRMEIEKRVLTPFEVRDDAWWMGFLRKDLCNWTPWIVSNVMVTAALEVKDPIRLSEMTRRALLMVDRWLAIVPEDGGCDEGVAYWNMAGGALMDILQLVSELTGGRADFSLDAKLRGILSFPRNMWLGGAWFANFADCDAKPYVCAERLIRAGQYLKDEQLETFGSTLLQPVSRDVSDTPQMWRMLNRLFACKPEKTATAQPPVDSWLPDLQVRLVSRSQVTACGKGGHNGESHNHNDVGSFVVFLKGEPVAVDIGNMTYTAKTFSSRRYELFNTRSKYHSVPEIGGMEQCVGMEYAASEVNRLQNGLSVDLAGAYPAQAGAVHAVRTWNVSEDGVFSLSDEVTLEEDREVCFPVILREKPVEDGDGLLSGGMRLTWTSDGPVHMAVEEIRVEDARLANSYPGSLWKLSWTSEPAQKHTFCLTMTPCSEKD